MGSFYTNVTLRTSDRQRVSQELAASGLSAFISRPENGALVVFERESDGEDPAVVHEVAATLSSRLGCPALACLNHDDSVLVYMLFANGELVDEYMSAPDYFDEEVDGGDRGGDADSLAEAFGVPQAVPRLATILSGDPGEDGLEFETERHARIVEALGLPRSAIGTGFNYLEAGEHPAGYAMDDFERVGEP